MFFRKKKPKIKKRKKKLFFLLFTAVFICWLIFYFSSDNNYKSSFNKIIVLKSKKYRLDPALVKAVIWKESKFNPNAKGGHGECGLMQIRPSTAVKDWEKYYKINLKNEGILFNPELNIEIGCWYLASCRKHWIKYSNPDILMLAEYNAGYSNIKQWVKNCSYSDKNLIKIIKFTSTKEYIRNILNKYNTYKKEKVPQY
ncbi:MAG: lytic transglycosylase domain-containing protein [Victivallales bacterium]|nr:lytic transglycosylase domain-containing protein [Victivallales bacterium]MCF7888619.1 lytic transglycosylase domain-containing protein [Victivallales bacterium]